MSDWMGFIGTICGTLAGGWLAIKASTRQVELQSKVEDRKKHINIFEEIHKNITDVNNGISTIAVSLILQLERGAKLQLDPSRLNIPIDELKMKVDFYAPFLREKVAEIDKSWVKVVHLLSEIWLNGEPKDEKRKFISTSLSAAQQEISKSCLEAREILAYEFQLIKKGS